jgi:desulfoferrodoxin-like iron-binding protein
MNALPIIALFDHKRQIQENEQMANQLGKRFTCEKCGAQVLVTKAGAGEISCCGQAMKQVEAKKLPSSD